MMEYNLEICVYLCWFFFFLRYFVLEVGGDIKIIIGISFLCSVRCGLIIFNKIF